MPLLLGERTFASSGRFELYELFKPRMSNRDFNVRVDVVGTKAIVRTQLNVDDMPKERHFVGEMCRYQEWRSGCRISTNGQVNLLFHLLNLTDL